MKQQGLFLFLAMQIAFKSIPTFETKFYPFASLRAPQDLRLAYFTIKERWEELFKLFSLESITWVDEQEADYIIHPFFIPELAVLQNDHWYLKNLFVGEEEVFHCVNNKVTEKLESVLVLTDLISVLKSLKVIIELDAFLLSRNYESVKPKRVNSTETSSENCFFGQNVVLNHCVLNTKNGPILIGDNVQINEFAVIYGPAVIQANSTIGPHTYLRQNVVVGKNSIVCGEVKNSIVMSNSNKGHYGYLGDSIVGEFCNLGAGTTTSNLKNNFSPISVYSKEKDELVKTQSNKLGSFIGDFSMTAVNSVLNAGTSVGVHSHVFGNHPLPKYFKDFSWGVEETYSADKWQQTSKNLLLHKGLDESEINELIGKLGFLFTEL